MTTVLFSELFLIVGLIGGWFFAEKYIAHLTYTEHDFEELFENNPHPELYDKNGKLNRGEYVSLNFDPGYDCDDFDPDDIVET